jgi:UDP-N-acetylmuramoyl-tripeptide--D-alanyl-D-alanine ligase
MRIRASQIAAVLGGVVAPHSQQGEAADPVITSVSFDSRELLPGSLFVALTAQRDGHDYISAAASAGAVACLQSRPDVGDDRLLSILVPEVAQGLLDLAASVRREISSHVVGLTGSAGKTSTKDLVLAAVGGSCRAWGSERSFNNEQGLPVTILNAPEDVEVLVLEMGMRGLGQITRLCDVAAPDVGVITNVGYAHTALVGGIEGVAQAKGELIAALPAHGTAILNADDERVLAMAGRGPATPLTYGSTPSVDVRITSIDLDSAARARCTLETPWGRFRFDLRIPGAHMAHNAAAAIAVAGVCGADLDLAAAAISEAEISGMRMQVKETASGSVLIDDSYNANPTSMAAALHALAAIEAKRRIAVVGVMAELDETESQHRAITALAKSLNVELWPVGTEHYGLDQISDPVSAVLALGPKDAVLFKGSRVAGLERLVRAVEAPSSIQD